MQLGDGMQQAVAARARQRPLLLRAQPGLAEPLLDVDMLLAAVGDDDAVQVRQVPTSPTGGKKEK